MLHHFLADKGRKSTVKIRNLELLSLEDRSVPAALNLYSHTAERAPAPIDSTAVVAAPTVSKLTLASQTETSQGNTLSKLSANHNQTLVRDRHRGKSHRR
jgi:hypothetical protein